MSILLSQPARKLLLKGFRIQSSPLLNGNDYCKMIGFIGNCFTPNSRIHLVSRNYGAKKDISVRKGESELQTDVKVTVKEATKTASYSAIILLGIGVTAALFYAVFKELFSSKSPSGVYSNAFKICSEDTRVQDALGTPIKGFGEETSRGRRRHVK